MLEFPPVPSGEPITISASSYVAYRQCPSMAGARFDGVYGPDSIASFRGGLAHAVFARHLTAGPIGGEAFDATCKELIGSSNLNHKVAGLHLRPSEVTAAIEEARALYERFKKLPEAGFAGAEELIEVEAMVDVTLVGRIDAIFDAELGTRLVDWKSGNLGDPEDQLRFYALLWVLDRDELPASVEAYSVRTGETLRAVPAQSELADTARDVAGLVAAVRRWWAEREPLPARGGPWCRFCPLLADCTEGRATIGVLGSHPAGGSGSYD